MRTEQGEPPASKAVLLDRRFYGYSLIIGCIVGTLLIWVDVVWLLAVYRWPNLGTPSFGTIAKQIIGCVVIGLLAGYKTYQYDRKNAVETFRAMARPSRLCSTYKETR
jgi:hypothetical protein